MSVSPQVIDVAITDATFTNGALSTGDTVTITATMDQLTLVTGTPQLTLDIGGTTVNASYVTGDGTDLQFAYTIQPGLQDLNGVFSATGLQLHGGTLNGAADGSPATLTFVHVDLDPFAAFPVNAPPSLGITDNELGPDPQNSSPVGELPPGDFLNPATTDDFTPTLHGVALGAATISIFDSQAAVGPDFLPVLLAHDIPVAADGTWTYTFADGELPIGSQPDVPGLFDFSVTAMDADGNVIGTSADTVVNIQENAVCFLKGTRLQTPAGEAAIEDLQIGDLVSTGSGQAQAIKWIGRRSYVTRFLGSDERRGVLPVRIARGALAENVPHRDLFVSAEHCLSLEGALVPVRCLVNGQSIAYGEPPETIEYFHIELSQHDVLIAEGAAAESWLDCGNRNFFHNVMDYLELGLPDSAPARSCLPLVTNGPVLEQVRAAVLARATAMGYDLRLAA